MLSRRFVSQSVSYTVLTYENRIRDRNFFGPATTIIDPDLPLLEVFWKSALPWARVEGVPPANR